MTKKNTPARVDAALVFAPTKDMDVDEWLKFGRELSTIDKGIQWAVGDWINYGIANYHDGLHQASGVLSHMAPDTLVTYARVAGRFPNEQRKMDSLEWYHYRVMIKFTMVDEEVDKLLSEAIDNEWTAAKLEQELRARRDDNIAALTGGKSREEREQERAEARQLEIQNCARIHQIAASTKERAADVRIPRDVFYTTILPKIKDPGAKAAAMEASAK